MSYDGVEAAEDTSPFLTVARGSNGYYFATLMVWSALSGSFAMSKFGATRSKKKQKAVNEAQAWAHRERLEFRL